LRKQVLEESSIRAPALTLWELVFLKFFMEHALIKVLDQRLFLLGFMCGALAWPVYLGNNWKDWFMELNGPIGCYLVYADR
jgi:hypothetical protein